MALHAREKILRFRHAEPFLSVKTAAAFSRPDY